jgi:hypothetical protein
MKISSLFILKSSTARSYGTLIGMCLIFSFPSCNFNQSKNPMIGNWYGFEADSTYYELYVNDTLIVLHNQVLGPIGYDYKLQNNLLVVSNKAGMERTWQILDDGKDAFTLSDSLETIRYTRLEVTEDFFKSVQDSVSYEAFKKGFFQRFSDKTRK